MFGRIFNPENSFFRALGKLTDVVALSLLWLVCSLPLFTLGPASAALYRAVVRCVRRGTPHPYGVFFQTFKDNFKVGALTSLVVLAAAFVLVALHDVLFVLAGSSTGAVMAYYAYCILLLLPAGVLCYLFPVLSQFTFGVGGLVGTCFKLALAHLPSTLAMAVLLAAAVQVCLWFWLPALFLPVVVTLVASLLLERIFKPYLQQADSQT